MKQSLTPEPKDFSRIRGLFLRGSKNLDQRDWAYNMAASITTYEKAIRRGRAAERLGYPDLAEIFFARANKIRVASR